MMNQPGIRRIPPDQSSGSGHTFGSPRHPSIKDPILSKRVCFYKSGDSQFNGLRMVINNRTFKTFDALLDSLSKKVPLPFGVRNITTPRGVHAIYTLDELEDGKSYICSDSRKVKPINLALARKKLPPWYHARPVSSRRRTVQQARFFPGRSIHRQERVVVLTPKKLRVFRNGDPTVKHTVVLHKRTTPTFESVLEYLSELMQFHVVKLHTPDGRRVDSLPGLIMCSGTVVAAGREPFRSANYNVQKSPAPTRLPTNRTGLRRLKSLNRKKKSMSYSSKSRNFSPSSERYILNQIHNSIAESSCDLPSNPTNSVELESSRLLGSVAETEEDTCLGDGAEGQGCLLPTEDDIEKSFRVNQDGSMTVEMRVRLTIKEEETIHWTTTLSRSSVANQLNPSCLPEPEVKREICSPTSNQSDLQSPATSSDRINKDRTKDDNDEDPPSLSNGAISDSGNEEDNIKVQAAASPRRAPTPGHKQIRNKHASQESIKLLMADGIQEGMVGSHSIETGAMSEKYCMVKQSTTRPVPKPRRFGSVDAYNIGSRNVSAFTSTGMTEILRVESSGDEVTETVLHIYEQQSCQDNFFANICSQSLSASGIPFGRPATSETGQASSNNEFEPELWRPSTASESINVWRAENISVASGFSSLRTGAIQAIHKQQQFLRASRNNDKAQQRDMGKAERAYSKPKAVRKHSRRLMTPRKRQKKKSAEGTETHKKVKTFSSAGFIKRIYGSKSKPAKPTMKLKKGPSHKGGSHVTSQTSQPSDKTILKDQNIQSLLTQNPSETALSETDRLNVSSTEVSQSKGILTRQTSVHQEKKTENKSYDISKNMALPAFNSCSSVTNKYVENWLEMAHINSPSCREEALILPQTEDERREEEKSDTQPRQTLNRDPLLESLGSSVKLRIQRFESKSSSPSADKTAPSHQGEPAQSQLSTMISEESVAQSNTEEISSKMNPVTKKTSTEMETGTMVENKTNPVKISLQKATPCNTMSMELPPPPPPAELTEQSNTESYMMDESSMASSPLYRLSSASSQMSDNHPLSISPTSDQTASPPERTMETTISVQTDTPALKEGPLPRPPSIKRAPLVSNLSLERKMSVRKACLDKYTPCSDAGSDTSSSSTLFNTLADDDEELPNAISLTETQRPQEQTQHSNSIFDLKSSPSCCSSATPTSVTSGERESSASISSNEPLRAGDTPIEEAKANNTPLLTQKGASSPKPVVKKAKLVSSPSPERKPQTKKLSSELANYSPKSPSSHNHHPDKRMSPNIGVREHTTTTVGSSPERKMVIKPNPQKRPSPYAQSLDVVSPPVRHKSRGKMLSRNLSSESVSEPTTKTPTKTRSERKHRQTSQSIKSTVELEKMIETIGIDKNKAEKRDDLIDTDEEKSVTESLLISQPNQPNMKLVLDKICYSIKSIREITKNKNRSCLEKSSSLPDFSSHVASTFGSSSKALLAFLSVMTLKEGITNFNMNELNPNHVSCAEALKIIDSLTEIARIEDSNRLKVCLLNLQKSTSKQLLQSWRDFQELTNKCKSSISSTPRCSEEGREKEGSTEKDVINEIMENFDIPEKLKVELASLSMEVKTESEDEENMSAEFTGKGNSDPKLSHSSSESAVNIRDVVQNDKIDTDVSAIIKKFRNINQPKLADMGGVPLTSETVKQKPNDQPRKAMNSCQEEYLENQETLSINRLINSKKDHENESPEEACGQLDMESEESMSIPETVPGSAEESASDEKGRNVSSANRQREKQNVYSSAAVEGPNWEEEEPEIACEEIKQEGSEDEDLFKSDSRSEEEDDTQSSEYVELNVSRKESVCSPDREDRSLTVEEQTETDCKDLYDKDASSHPAGPPTSEMEPEYQNSCMGLNVGVDESTGNSDVDEPTSSEEEAESKELKVIAEETLSGTEEDKDSIEGEENLDDLPESGKAFIEKTEKDRVSSEDEDSNADILDRKTGSNLTENLVIFTKKEASSLIKSESLAEHYRFNADEDSGNDHSGCVEQVEAQQITNQQISSSIEEELSYYEKESSSEEEQVKMDCKEYQEVPAQPKLTKCEKAAEKVQHQCEERISQSVAERVSLLEKQAADVQKKENVTDTSAVRRFSQTNARRESDVEESPSESPTSQSTLCTRSAPQSSLSFSYDSSCVITTEPEGNKVRSIREMFLAKSATDIQHGCRRFPIPNASELSDLRAETSASGGYQSQTSSELSSGEDDSGRKSITKGFVRRAIERLYGKKDANPEEEACDRPPSAPKQKKKEHSSIFSPFHLTPSKALSELSYFNSTNTLDTLSEATRCIAFNAQVGPGDSVPIDSGRWLLRENTLIRKSVSDPVGINKAFTKSPLGEGLCEDTEENATYSLFSTKSEVEDQTKSLTRKCTYFSLPHANDSDVCQDDLSTASKSSANGDSVIDAEDSKMRAERNGKLPSVGVTDFKMMDNKVHPMMEAPSDGGVVVVQPGKGQGIVNRRLQEPDVLDLLYNFCGQHCPIL